MVHLVSHELHSHLHIIFTFSGIPARVHTRAIAMASPENPVDQPHSDVSPIRYCRSWLQ